MSGAEHVPNDMHPGLAPLREVEQGRTISKSSVPIIDTTEIKRFTLFLLLNNFGNHPTIFVYVCSRRIPWRRATPFQGEAPSKGSMPGRYKKRCSLSRVAAAYEKAIDSGCGAPSETAAVAPKET